MAVCRIFPPSIPLLAIFFILSIPASNVKAETEMGSSLFSTEKEKVYKNSFMDDQCLEMANERPSKCVAEPEIMEKLCKKACMDKLPYFKSNKYDDDGSFFELNAKRLNGKNLDFERFIGFITAVINVPVSCSEGESDNLARDFKKLLKITPKQSIEFVVFPILSDDRGCESLDMELFSAIFGKSGNVHVMEATNVNGPNTHPVYKYLKNVVELEDMIEDISTLMFINPMGSQIDALEGQNFDKIKRYTKEHLQNWEL